MSEKKRSIIGPIISDENLIVRASVNMKVIRETRSRRVGILVRPSVYDLAAEKCKKMNISMNEGLNRLIEDWVYDRIETKK